VGKVVGGPVFVIREAWEGAATKSGACGAAACAKVVVARGRRSRAVECLPCGPATAETHGARARCQPEGPRVSDRAVRSARALDCPVGPFCRRAAHHQSWATRRDV
jgi:hypothetical protein